MARNGLETDRTGARPPAPMGGVPMHRATF